MDKDWKIYTDPSLDGKTLMGFKGVTKLAGGYFINEDGTWTHCINGDGTWTRVYSDGTCETFDGDCPCPHRHLSKR